MLRSMTFEVIGEQPIHCEGCQQRIERLLKAMQGVAQVRAQAHNQRIEILFDAALIEDAAIAKRLKEAGYETGVRTVACDSGQRMDINQSELLAEVELLIPNMVCEGCAEKISSALNSLPGVRKVKSKVRKKQIFIQYEPGRVQKERLKETVVKAGFTAVET